MAAHLGAENRLCVLDDLGLLVQADFDALLPEEARRQERREAGQEAAHSLITALVHLAGDERLLRSGLAEGEIKERLELRMAEIRAMVAEVRSKVAAMHDTATLYL